ncbi:hypothetical protein C8R46DRAFT_1317894 [Mycena filopes]|nr:hypothetical protein C8R46DRAFT_1317894 [Mycena filopes]
MATSETLSILSRLPQELADQFIEHNASDLGTLRSSALVCRAFVASSQACIFSELTITTGSGTQRLFDILYPSPHLAAHVRTLEIQSSGTNVWSSAAVDVLGLLTRVTSLTLEFQKGGVSEWRLLPQSLRTAICRLCQRSALVSLKLNRPRVIADMEEFSQLVASPALKKLSFINVEFAPSQNTLPATHHPHLTDCHFVLVPHSLDLITPWLTRASTLQRLDLWWLPQTSPNFQILLDASGASLEHLILNHYRFTQPSGAETLSLKNLRALRRLQLFEMLNGQGDFEELSDLAALVRALTALLNSGPATLTAVIVNINLWVFEEPRQPIPWTQLDILLSGEWKRFPSLVKVEFRVKRRARPGLAVHLERLLGVLGAALPRTRARGIFRCGEVL